MQSRISRQIGLRDFREFEKASSIWGRFERYLKEIRSLSCLASPHFGPCSFASLRTRFGDNDTAV